MNYMGIYVLCVVSPFMSQVSIFFLGDTVHSEITLKKKKSETTYFSYFVDRTSSEINVDLLYCVLLI